MDQMTGIGQQMPRVFAFFTAGSLASLALPGMSGFVGELTIFLGFTSSDAYTTSFKAVVVLLAAVGVILAPIYLLSMLRQIFYGQEQFSQLSQFNLTDIKPREAFIAACLIVPIIGIGIYPKLATQMYDAKTESVVAEARGALVTVAENPFHVTLPHMTAPSVFGIEAAEFTRMSD